MGAAYGFDCGLWVTRRFARTGISTCRPSSPRPEPGTPSMLGTPADLMAHMRADHTPAEDAGRIAQEAGVKTHVLSPLTPAGVGDETWRSEAARHFTGEIIVAQDRMVI
jgi:hypothetical protein